MLNNAVFQVNDLKTYFYTGSGVVKAVNGVSFQVQAGKTLCIVGESGCGKSITLLSLLGLIEVPGKIISGEVYLNDRDILKLSSQELRKIRGKEISLIFQDPMTSLNPVLKIGCQLTETILAHENCSKKEARDRSVSMLKKVGLPDPEKIMKRFSFQLSGGMRQRVMIAQALSLFPEVLIADEPTTALDVTVQAQILWELKKIQKEFNTALILVTHNLGVVAELADEVAVMYAGSIVEYGPVLNIFETPLHPYTQALLNSMPKFGYYHDLPVPIQGQPPNLLNLPEQCAFAPRCSYVDNVCLGHKPGLTTINPGHKAACHKLKKPFKEGSVA
ncbi:oligopeptide/dipeptide ABC transporter, ATPase subunit [Desulfofarcimen acetoxidans DSM 771]|uniref:Oligopeptide/dipeptide ABC transporter, ATPase subunit n=1 Tax=Desulfofarcimen acetoxidans (strain ATCC 49208 / DSM 771 / KCTC 5769 / VKM B-1644 / 5575) TaxID=485916 RepID=C8W4W8_DESAS|nr:ABC transporter ATP-binding protein [Desulfofarcimen acetoxidans]ACV61320.1 oligopeptide/dipeptide ABC transporter, ATPase subunit [Desulfofarcimen acetoxidans DSM 771]